MEFRSCARGRQWCGICHYHWWTASIKPRLLFFVQAMLPEGFPFHSWYVTAVWRQTQYHPDRWRPFDAKHNATQTDDGRLTPNTEQYHQDKWRPFDTKHNITQRGDGRLTTNTIPPRQMTAVWRQTQYHPDRLRPFDAKHNTTETGDGRLTPTQCHRDRWRPFDANTIPPRQVTAVWRQTQYHPDMWRPFDAKPKTT